MCTQTPDKVHETQGTHRHNTRYTRHKVCTDTRQGAQSHWVSTETPDKVGRDRKKDEGGCRTSRTGRPLADTRARIRVAGAAP